MLTVGVGWLYRGFEWSRWRIYGSLGFRLTQGRDSALKVPHMMDATASIQAYPMNLVILNVTVLVLSFINKVNLTAQSIAFQE